MISSEKLTVEQRVALTAIVAGRQTGHAPSARNLTLATEAVCTRRDPYFMCSLDGVVRKGGEVRERNWGGWWCFVYLYDLSFSIDNKRIYVHTGDTIIQVNIRLYKSDH